MSLNLSRIKEPTKQQVAAVELSQKQPRYDAELRRKGRGCQTKHVTREYLKNYNGIFRGKGSE